VKTVDFDYELPEALIALRPAEPRESARLLQLSPAGALSDHRVGDLPHLLRPGDVMVFNDTRVIPALLKGSRRARGEGNNVAIDVLLHQPMGENAGQSIWSAMARPAKRLRPGDLIHFGEGLSARVEGGVDGGLVTLAMNASGEALMAALLAVGAAPLPPYIARKRAPDAQDREDYQTVFAKNDGSVAAPTAGLHFTSALLAALDHAGIERVHVTLHVGLGTFLPVKTDMIKDHRMHSERYSVSEEAAACINRARSEGRRIIAVGTTAMRTLESVGRSAMVNPGTGETDIFIAPGFEFRICDGLWTNFHLPQSTLLMLVSAFCGRERVLAGYRHAIEEGYRFFSYGDASLLWKAP
jgi:S-adenosylmethionine:tRNA ribosyltransferase-isomerase